MDNATLIDYLQTLPACSESIQWVARHGGSAGDAWHDCVRGDWMGWLLGRVGLLGTPQYAAAALSDLLDMVADLSQVVRDTRDVLLRYANGVMTIKDVEDAGEYAGAALRAYYLAGGTTSPRAKAIQSALHAAVQAVDAVAWLANMVDMVAEHNGDDNPNRWTACMGEVATAIGEAIGAAAEAAALSAIADKIREYYRI